MIRLCLCTCWVDLSTRFSLFVMKCIKIINDTKFMLVSFDVNLMYYRAVKAGTFMFKFVMQVL